MYKSIFLDEFIEKFNNQGMFNSTVFLDLYEDYILKSGYDLRKEITENLLTLDSNNHDLYFEYVLNRIKSEAFSSIDQTFLDKWVVKYNLEELDFPYFKDEEMKIILSTWVDQPGLSYDEETNVRNIQKDFYFYAFHLEKMNIIEFIESKKSMGDIKIEKNQLNELTVNQAVILLDKLGVFSSTMFEKVPNTKKAKLISQLLGKNVKNVKTAIEKLELKTSAVKPNYQKDIDKIERILDNLE